MFIAVDERDTISYAGDYHEMFKQTQCWYII